MSLKGRVESLGSLIVKALGSEGIPATFEIREAQGSISLAIYARGFYRGMTWDSAGPQADNGTYIQMFLGEFK